MGTIHPYKDIEANTKKLMKGTYIIFFSAATLLGLVVVILYFGGS